MVGVRKARVVAAIVKLGLNFTNERLVVMVSFLDDYIWGF